MNSHGFRAKGANQTTQKLLSTDLVNTDYKSSNARSRSDWSPFQAAFKRRIFGRPKNLTGHFVHREPYVQQFRSVPMELLAARRLNVCMVKAFPCERNT